MTTSRDHGRETRAPPEEWSQTVEAPNLGCEADPISIACEVGGFPRLDQRTYETVQLLQGDGGFG